MVRDYKGQNIAVFDLDRTITQFGTFTPYLFRTTQLGLSKYWRYATLLPLMLQYKQGKIGRKHLKEQMIKRLLNNRDRAEMDACAVDYAKWLMAQGHYRPGALKQIKQHQQQDDLVVMATASMDWYAQKIGDQLGFDMVIGTQSCWQDDILQPTIIGENCYGDNKRLMIEEAFKKHAIDRAGKTVIAYTDHVSDLPFLHWSDKPVAVNPSKKLERAAKEQNIPIEIW